LYLLATLIIAFLLMALVCRPTNSYDTFALRIFSSSMVTKIGKMFLFFGFVTLFMVTLIRQVRLKFNSHFSNIVLIACGARIFYLFQKFIKNITTIKSVFIEKGDASMVQDLDNEIILFRLLQAFVGIVVIISLMRSINKIRNQNNFQHQ
jgi:hypothetical protein